MVDTPEWMRCGLKTFQHFLKWAPNVGIPLAQNMTDNRAMYDSYCANLWPPLPPSAEPTVHRYNSPYHAASNGAQLQPNLPLGPAVDQSQTRSYVHVDGAQSLAGLSSSTLMGQPQSTCYPALETARPQTSLPFHQGQPPTMCHRRYPQSFNTPNAYYNAAVPAQKTWLCPGGESQFPQSTLISIQNAGNVYQGTQQLSNNAAAVQNAGNVYQGTQQFFINAAPVQNTGNVYQGTQESFNNATPVQNVGNVFQGTQQLSNNAITPVQNAGNVYQGTQKLSNNAITPVQNAGNVCQSTQQYPNNAAPVQNAGNVYQGTQESFNNATPVQNVGNVFQGTQQLSNNAITPVQNAGNVYQGTQQRSNDPIDPMQGIECSSLNNAPSMKPDTPQSSYVLAAASGLYTKYAQHPAKALEKAVEKKAKDYGLDSATTRQLRAYANAREKGIEASEPEDAVSQHIIYEFQAVRQKHKAWTTFPECLPGKFCLLPSQKQYNQRGGRSKDDEREVMREKLHNKNRDRWCAAATPPPMGSKPHGIIKASPVKQRKTTLQAPSPMQVSNIFYAIPHQSYSAPAYSTRDQTMGSQSSNFTSPTTMMLAMAPVADCRPSSFTQLSTVPTAPTSLTGNQSFNPNDNTTMAPAMTLIPGDEPSRSTSSLGVPTGLTPKGGNRVWSTTEPSEELLQPMPAIGNEPSGPATSSTMAPTPIQATSNEIQQSTTPPITPPTPVKTTSTELREPADQAVTPPERRHETWTSNSRGVLCRKGVENVPCHSGSFFPNESKLKRKKPQGAINTTTVAPKMNEIVAKGPTDTATETTAMAPTTSQNAGNAPTNSATDTTATQRMGPPGEGNNPVDTSKQTTDTNTEEVPNADNSNRQSEKWIDDLFEEEATDTATETTAMAPTTNQNVSNEPTNSATNTIATLPVTFSIGITDPINTSNQTTDSNNEIPDADILRRQQEKEIDSLFIDDVEDLAEGLDFWPEVIEMCGG